MFRIHISITTEQNLTFSEGASSTKTFFTRQKGEDDRQHANRDLKEERSPRPKPSEWQVTFQFSPKSNEIRLDNKILSLSGDRLGSRGNWRNLGSINISLLDLLGKCSGPWRFSAVADRPIFSRSIVNYCPLFLLFIALLFSFVMREKAGPVGAAIRTGICLPRHHCRNDEEFSHWRRGAPVIDFFASTHTFVTGPALPPWGPDRQIDCSLGWWSSALVAAAAAAARPWPL